MRLPLTHVYITAPAGGFRSSAMRFSNALTCFFPHAASRTCSCTHDPSRSACVLPTKTPPVSWSAPTMSRYTYPAPPSPYARDARASAAAAAAEMTGVCFVFSVSVRVAPKASEGVFFVPSRASSSPVDVEVSSWSTTLPRIQADRPPRAFVRVGLDRDRDASFFSPFSTALKTRSVKRNAFSSSSRIPSITGMPATPSGRSASSFASLSPAARPSRSRTTPSKPKRVNVIGSPAGRFACSECASTSKSPTSKTPTAPCDAHFSRAAELRGRWVGPFGGKKKSWSPNEKGSSSSSAELLGTLLSEPAVLTGTSSAFSSRDSRLSTLVISLDPENNAPPGFATAPTTTAPGAAACSRPVNVSTSRKSAHANINAATRGFLDVSPVFFSALFFVFSPPRGFIVASSSSSRSLVDPSSSLGYLCSASSEALSKIRLHCSKVSCEGRLASWTWKATASTFGMIPAKTLTPNPSTTAPRPPIAPVTTPPNRAGPCFGGFCRAGVVPSPESFGSVPCSVHSGVKHSMTYAGAALGSAYADDTITCTNVGTASWPRLFLTSATASTTANDRSSRFESPEAKRIRGVVSGGRSEATSERFSERSVGGAGDERVA
mmetsp:Transcript_1586/g.6632  ORF Transcript_1586/g.6632 Transcript_1586/m.6632 type:complete len:606 (+) Transcript_1586:267-2084(+)